MDVENGILQKNQGSPSSSDLIEWKGHDFLFLFDLIACTCGRAATLRVLSYTSTSFENLCQPRMMAHRTVTMETSIKIYWQHARLQDIKAYYQLSVDEYIVTIFPGFDFKSLSSDAKETEFKHLAGGTTQVTRTVKINTSNPFIFSTL